jgi:hypothetical protein
MTNEPHVPTKAELLDALRSSAREVVERVGALPAASLEEGRYESGWNGRQILAHVASIEWTYARLFDVAREAPAVAEPAAASAQVRRTEPGEAPNTPTRIAQGGIDSYNERQVAKRAEASVAELIEEFKTNRAATIAAAEACDEALLARPKRSAGGITRPRAGGRNAVAVQHVRAHLSDIAGGR